ncbi:albusnodin/ikarugamycin family macrolactam cyclase [Streptomyces albidoflavus]|uniref:albusnodin/ikarugamycin family macrolactam cyclase n=1 Tax=Streptomyces albidoflavus TaxID=1886 RepID=UPI00315AFAED
MSSTERWTGGGQPGGTGPAVVSQGARVRWSDPLWWTAGNWAGRLLCLDAGESTRIAVFGASEAGAAGLARALAAPDLGAAVRGWPGAFGVVRAVDGRVEVLADAVGTVPVYWTSTATGIVWSTHARALAALAGDGPDLAWLGAYLRDQRAPAACSAFAGVHRVPPGHRLVLTERGASVSPWWSVPHPDRYEVAVARLRTALTGAVRVRVGSGKPVSTDLAGMDSTTLTVLAERYGPVNGVTAHPRGVTAGGDLDFARTLSLPQLTRRTFELTDEHLPFAEAELPATDQPPLSAHLWGMFSAQLAAARPVHLTGDGGDHLFQPAPTHLADLVAHGRLLHAARDAAQWARARRISPVPVLRHAIARDVAALGASGAGAAASWLTPGTAYDRDPVDRTAAAALTDSLRAAARRAQADTELAASVGVELHNPYHDAAVLDAVLAARSWERVSSTRYKPMLVDAFGDLLPARHRDRTTKGTFETSFHAGVRARLPHLLDHCDGHLAALGLIRPEQLRAALHRAALGARTPWRAILAVYGAEVWLRAVGNAPAPTWAVLTPARRMP